MGNIEHSAFSPDGSDFSPSMLLSCDVSSREFC
uniref:Uncharacterized protein n=1 Tax=Anguilla anguilla TaxID=7936 RepID=A0A0E9QQ14_ANGAN